MENRDKLRWCLATNGVVLLVVVLIVSISGAESDYWRFGPGDDLVIISVQVDTWGRWVGLILLISLVEATRVVVDEVGSPLLRATLHDPTNQVIELGRAEFELFANLNFLMGSIRTLLLMLVTISQIDIAVWGIISAQIATFIVLRTLLRGKRFQGDGGDDLGGDEVYLTRSSL